MMRQIGANATTAITALFTIPLIFWWQGVRHRVLLTLSSALVIEREKGCGGDASVGVEGNWEIVTGTGSRDCIPSYFFA